MSKHNIFFIGLDTHKEFVEIAYIEDQRGALPVHCSRVSGAKASIIKLARQFQSKYPNANTVGFRYKDSQTKLWKTRTLPTLKFLMLILQHVLPKGLQRVRDYGFLRGNAKTLRQRIQMLLLPLFYQMKTKTTLIRNKATRACPCCQHEMNCVGVSRPT